METNTTIHILGAYDRHNYGDLLFPIILENILKLKIHENCKIKIYALRKSDLSNYGALKTNSLSELYKALHNSKNKDILLVAGGDVMTAQWSSILLSLNHPGKIFMKGATITNKIFNRNKLARFLLGGKSDFPFVLDKNKFEGLDMVIYNSIGGTNFHKFQHLYGDSLFSDYLSVRDKTFYERVKKLNKNVKLVPDSAIYMSMIFPLEKLKAKVSQKVLEFTSDNNFVFFQINKTLSKNNLSLISKTLENISTKFNLKICLCPIGRANQHEDHIPLEEIHKKLEKNSFYIEHPSIWDVMYLISKSNIYIGTSLHGAITAMSYNVPYMGIKVTKLNDYLRTWSFEPLNRVYSIEEIIDNFDKIINVDKDMLTKSRSEQIKLTENSFTTIINLINSI